MHKILLIGKRDYLATIRTRAFLISMVAGPLLCGGILAPGLLQGRKDINGKRIAVVDRTGLAGSTVVEALRKQNEHDLFDKTTGLQALPRYQFENVVPDAGDPAVQRLALSDRVRRQELFAFAEIGAHALEPNKDAARETPDNSIEWFSNGGDLDTTQQWMPEAINNALHEVRLARLGVDRSRSVDVLAQVPVEKMGLVSRDEKTGQIGSPRKKGKLDFMVPIVVMMLMLLIVTFTSTPMLTAISEDKMQRVFEMLLVSATPFELIAGKVLAAVGRSLTSAVAYIAAAGFALYGLAMVGIAPIEVLPWFVIYLIAEVTMLSALASALGAACSTPQDANSFSMILAIPMLASVFAMSPILAQPNGSLAFGMSMFPLFTPMLMLMRQVSPGGVPAWQPWVALAGVAVATVAISWLAARIFRVGILLQGKPPKFSDLMRWAVRG